MKIQIRKNPKVKQKWHFRIVAPNGRILASSENYLEKRKCARAASRILRSTSWVVDVEK